MDLKEIQFVTALHGNERVPVLALASLGVAQAIGNPKALAVNKRFTESDLNGVFGEPEKDYETRRAKELLLKLSERKFVVDFHTFKTDGDPFVIIVDMEMLDLALATGLTHIVYMKFNIKRGKALINFRKGISVEVGQHDTPESFETTRQVIKNLQTGARAKKAYLYETFGEITEPGKYVNFQKHAEGFYPIFAMKNTYGNYGIKTTRKLLKMGK